MSIHGTNHFPFKTSIKKFDRVAKFRPLLNLNFANLWMKSGEFGENPSDCKIQIHRILLNVDKFH
jgi:hypothetical protein